MARSLGNLRIVGLLVPAMGLVASTIVLAAPVSSRRPSHRADAHRRNVRQHPDLSWTKAVGATSYEVEIDNASDFSSPSCSVSTTNNRAAPTVHLPNGDLLWRVRAVVSGSTRIWAGEHITIDASPPPTPISCR